MKHSLRILIVDDERAARQRIADLLAGKSDVEIVGEAKSGPDAVRAIEDLKPDLVFLDMQMPGASGIDVVRRVGPERMPAVVFVTAYDSYAVAAFEVAALDYLLKPFADDRFEQALSRAREMIAGRQASDLQRRFAALIAPGAEVAPAAPSYLQRIAVEGRGQIRIIPVETIDFLTASGSYAELHVGQETFIIREQMQALEERLDPAQFIRIHRSTIVQADRIHALLFNPGGDYAALLNDGRRLKVSRSRWDDLTARLGSVPSQKA